MLAQRPSGKLVSSPKTPRAEVYSASPILPTKLLASDTSKLTRLEEASVESLTPFLQRC
jgi:hypothetical protein